MEDEIYKQYILTVYSTMSHKKEIEGAAYIANGYNASCGDKITMQIKVDDNEIITDAGFVGDGCILSQVSAELLCGYIIGKRMIEIQKITFDELLELVGIRPSPTRMRCIELSLISAKQCKA